MYPGPVALARLRLAETAHHHRRTVVLLRILRRVTRRVGLLGRRLEHLELVRRRRRARVEGLNRSRAALLRFCVSLVLQN